MGSNKWASLFRRDLGFAVKILLRRNLLSYDKGDIPVNRDLAFFGRDFIFISF